MFAIIIVVFFNIIFYFECYDYLFKFKFEGNYKNLEGFFKKSERILNKFRYLKNKIKNSFEIYISKKLH